MDWLELIDRPNYRHINLEYLQYCQKEKGFIIYAWGYMTNKMHMIVGSRGENKVQGIQLINKTIKILRTL